MRKLFAVFGLLLLFLPAVRAAEDAQALFNAKCSTCHGVKGDGKGHEGMKIKPADLRSAAVQKLSDEELFKTIASAVISSPTRSNSLSNLVVSTRISLRCISSFCGCSELVPCAR